MELLLLALIFVAGILLGDIIGSALEHKDDE